MAERNARYLCHLSRRGSADPQTQHMAQDLGRKGITVEVVQGDVGIKADVERLIEHASRSRPIKGIINSALILEVIHHPRLMHVF